MKSIGNTQIAALLCMLLSIAYLTGCTAKGNATSEFWVRANCEMCKDKIEGALESTLGVASAKLDLETNIVSVSFDSTKVGTAALHKACADVGYETKLSPAAELAYQSLPKCCKKEADM